MNRRPGLSSRDIYRTFRTVCYILNVTACRTRGIAMRISRRLRCVFLLAHFFLPFFFSSFSLLLHTCNLNRAQSLAFPTRNGLQFAREGARVTLSLRSRWRRNWITYGVQYFSVNTVDFLQLVSISCNENAPYAISQFDGGSNYASRYRIYVCVRACACNVITLWSTV